jgi:hypothetical protein
MFQQTRLVNKTRDGKRYLDFDRERFWVVEELSEALKPEHRRPEIREAPRRPGELTRRLMLHDARTGEYIGTADARLDHMAGSDSEEE